MFPKCNAFGECLRSLGEFETGFSAPCAICISGRRPQGIQFKHNSMGRRALPVPITVCCIFCYGCQCLGISTCPQMLRHAIALGGCSDTVKGKLTLGGKSFVSNPRQYCAWIFSRTLYQLIKLQALVYDILPSTTAVFNYVIGS